MKEKIISYQVDEEFKKLWRSIPVDSMDDAKIEEYLEKQGNLFNCDSMQEIKNTQDMDCLLTFLNIILFVA